MSTTTAISNTMDTTATAPMDTKLLFGWIDYSLFILMLLMSALIGVYFGFFGKKQNTVSEYILGGKTMKIFPVSISLVSSMISGMAMLAVPADVYTYGVSYSLVVISTVFVGLTVYFVYFPVYHQLQVTSIYEYLNLRFGKSVRTLASFFYATAILIHMPIIIYVPALAFSQVSGVSVHVISPIVCVICIFYTTIGGLKAVVWTDALQFIIMLGAIVIVIYLGIVRAGGFDNIFSISSRGGRTFLFDFDLDPTNRTSFWTVVIGMYSNWTAYMAANQGVVQKILSLPSFKQVSLTIIIFVFGINLVKVFATFMGLLLYSEYHDCDPLSAGLIQRSDQLLPYYIMDIAGHIPGLPGIFIAGIFCAALSTMSAILNTLACTLYEDFIRPHMPANTTEKRASDIMKLLVVITGTLSTATVFFVEKMGSLLPLSMSLASLVTGPSFGMFTLGMLVPSANTKGVLSGTFAGLASVAFVVFGSQYHRAQGAVTMNSLPMSTAGCNYTFPTLPSSQIPYTPPFVFRISFYYFTVIGLTVTMLVGYIVSRLTGGANQQLDKELISPVMHWCLPKDKKCEYTSVKHVTEMLKKNEVVEQN